MVRVVVPASWEKTGGAFCMRVEVVMKEGEKIGCLGLKSSVKIGP